MSPQCFGPVWSSFRGALVLGLVAVALPGCRKADDATREAKEAPPTQAAAVPSNADVVQVGKPQQFPLVPVATQQMYSTLNATGSVNPDVSRELPVLSLANGRVTALHVRLGDTVRKGQLIMEVQSPDVTTAFDAYLKAVHDEHLARITLERDKLLFDKGAIAQTQLEQAQNSEEDAQADLRAFGQQLRILGVDKDHPGDSVRIYAPTSGVVIAQNATAAGAAGINYAGATGSLIIADLAHVWVICDVYENDLASVRLGEQAEIRLSAFPGRIVRGTVGDIGAILDPSIRTAKVRIQVENPDRSLRLGMFATATFRSAREATIVAVPGDAVLHLHDRSFVFLPTGAPGSFRTAEIKVGRALSGNQVEVVSGLQPGQQIVANALELQNAAAQ